MNIYKEHLPIRTHPGNPGKLRTMKIFNYSYYRLCDFYLSKRDSAAEMTSALIVSLIQFFTILDLLIIVRIFWEYPIPNNFSKYWFLPLIIILPFINWNIYVKHRKYREYRKLWSEESGKQRRKNGFFIVLYIMISMLIPVLYGLIRYNIMEGKSFFG